MAKRLGICIGVNTYQNKPTANLKFARRDAESIASLLKNTEYGGFDKVLEIYDDEANKASLIQTAKEIFLNPNLDSDDLIVFFFSGHGAVDRGEKLFLVPHDVKFLSDGSIDVSSVLHINELESFIDNSNSKNIVLLFDACHSGASSKLLGKIKYQDDTNVVLIGAARYSEKAWETPELEHGRFTESFLRCVNLVPSQGEWITLQQSLSFVQTEMQKMGSDQLMEVSSHAINQNIKLFKNPIYKLTSDEFTEQVKNLCEISNCTIVPIQSDLLLSNTFVMRESRSFGRFDQTLVICLDNSQIKLTTDNLIQFSSLFQSLQSEEIVTNGMLIVQNEISKIIRKSIDKSIAVQTLDEMQRNLMNFDRYLKQLVDDFTKGDPDRKGEPPLGEYYIELTAQKIFTLREIERKFESASINSDKNITNLIETILRLKIEERNSVLKSMLELSEKPSSSPELKSDLAKRLKFVYELFKPENISDLILGWLSDSDEKAVIILGGYGTGKTTFSRKLAYDLAQKYRLSTNKNGLRIPILFHLRRFPKFSNVDIEAAIIAHLKQQCLVSNPDFEAFKTMNRAGLFVLIFDGFDEMAVQGSNDIIRRNFIEIMEFARESNAKVIITSRPEAFLSDHEENEILQINDGFTQAEFPKLSRIILNTLSTTQVELFLQKRIPLIDKVVESGKGWEYYRDQINNDSAAKRIR